MLRLQSVNKIMKPYMYGYEIRVADKNGFGFRFEIVRAYQYEWCVFCYVFTKEGESMVTKVGKRLYGEMPDTYRTSRTAAQAVKEYVKTFNKSK